MMPFRLCLTLLGLGFPTGTMLQAEDAVIPHMLRHTAAHANGEAPFSFDHEAYRRADLSRLPIGVFDSGIGGLTVLEAILALDAFHNDSLQPGADGIPDFANERFIYFGDQANMPYGNYSAAGRTDYLRELILKDAIFLLGKRYTTASTARFDKPPVKAIVIACNTATAYGLDDIRACMQAWNLPVVVIGVVEAGARGVKEALPESAGSVGVLATVGTCASGAYPRLIKGVLGLAGRAVPAVTQQGSASLAGVIEGDPAFSQSVADQAFQDVRALADAHRQTGVGRPLQTVVLGCTHFPLARTEIDRAFAQLRQTPDYSGLIAEEIRYVDPAEWTARELFRELASAKLRLRTGERGVLPRHAFYISFARDSADGTLERGYKYGRSPGRLDVEDTVNVPMDPDKLPAVSRNLVAKKLPLVWNSLSTP